MVSRALPRRRLIQGSVALVSLGLMAGCVPAQVTRVSRVGVLTTASLETGRRKPQLEAFKEHLRGLGYVEGQNVRLEVRWSDDQLGKLPGLAAELVGLPVDVLVTADSSIAPAMQATKTMPIVFASSAAPLETGQVASYARPGGNVTGLADSGPEVSGKRVELLREMIPTLASIGIMGPDLTGSGRVATATILFKETEAAVRALGLEVLPLEVGSAEDIEAAFTTAVQRHVDALVVLRAPITNPNAARIIGLAATHRLPAMYGDELYTDVGGLVTYAPNHVELWRRAATYVDKILKGTKPADLPVEKPAIFNFIVNLKAAQALGLTIPPSVLQQATELIQ
jgi:putative tryptophan/tyrosine transport system substrate-binding protein